MRTLVIDPRFGAAGDMIVSSLLSLGADKNTVLAAVKNAAVPEIETVVRNGIEALSIHMNSDTAHRHIEEVLAKVDAAETSDEAKALAKRVFSRLEIAEAAVHHTHHPHFHEIGADDAVADIVGACTAILSLHIDNVCILPVATGSGTLHCSHGIMPVPAPATAEVLKNSSLNTLLGTFEGELCTPTGASLLAEFAETFCASDTVPAGKIIAIGRGAGAKVFDDHANILTSYIVESEDTESTVDVLETNVDDITGEVLANTITLLMENGARDASAVPIIMKKGRSGYLIRVICSPEKSAALAELLAKETGSLGIRCIPMVHRLTAERGFTSVTAKICGKEYTASVKYASISGSIYSRKAEFEDCRRIAAESGCPIRDVKRILEDAAWRIA
ncbi:MAG TPA: nickel pincer cofactor biosynthesis protein LarC [Methanocorpusculum sp.]|nr:nickel pincer cofactor biosynthesis protein LarC [Methanocorpusculum sp.]